MRHIQETVPSLLPLAPDRPMAIPTDAPVVGTVLIASACLHPATMVMQNIHREVSRGKGKTCARKTKIGGIRNGNRIRCLCLLRSGHGAQFCVHQQTLQDLPDICSLTNVSAARRHQSGHDMSPYGCGKLRGYRSNIRLNIVPISGSTSFQYPTAYRSNTGPQSAELFEYVWIKNCATAYNSLFYNIPLTTLHDLCI
jgi:hypothetical protein